MATVSTDIQAEIRKANDQVEMTFGRGDAYIFLDF